MVASAPVNAFLEYFLPVLRTVFCPSHWLLPHRTIAETMDNLCSFVPVYLSPLHVEPSKLRASVDKKFERGINKLNPLPDDKF